MMNKRKTVLTSLIGAMVLGISVYAGYSTYDSYQQTQLENNLILENIEALAQTESDPQYTWSKPIACDEEGKKTYCVCETNGPGYSCSNPGHKTCQCGVNC